jgi:NAD-dependent SIR2 family protein deacetylase
LVKAALKQQKPVVIVNRGQTKADGMVTAKINASITEVLPGLIDA